MDFEDSHLPFPFQFIEPEPEPPARTEAFNPLEIVAQISGRIQPTGRRDKIIVFHSIGRRDVQAEEIVAELACRGEPVFYFDTSAFLQACQVSIELGQPNPAPGLLRLPTGDLALDEVKSVWFRGPEIDLGEIKPFADRSTDFIRRETEATLGGLMGLLDQSFWMNPPAAVQSAQDKLAQLQQAEKLGLIIPRTLVTNDPQKLLEFYEACHGEMIIKTFTRLAYQQDGRDHLILTNRVLAQHLEQIARVEVVPCLFQEYVPKDIEIRVTVVGRQVFAVEIHSQSSPVSQVDYRRYDLAHTLYRPHSLPPGIQSACLGMLDAYGLAFGAIDLIRRPDGAYVFLEINANAQFLWVQDLTGLPVRQAIAERLSAASVD